MTVNPKIPKKIDECPGRLNQTYLFIKRIGVFFWWCWKIYEVNIDCLSPDIARLTTVKFHSYIMSKLNKN